MKILIHFKYILQFNFFPTCIDKMGNQLCNASASKDVNEKNCYKKRRVMDIALQKVKSKKT